MSGPYVYIQSEPRLWTVGHYGPETGLWIPESDHGSTEDAAARVHYLNGGTDKPASTRHGDGSTVADAKAGPLIRLETGEWIDPTGVRRVWANLGQVILTSEDGILHYLKTPDGTPEGLQAFADRIARQINAARQGGGA